MRRRRRKWGTPPAPWRGDVVSGEALTPVPPGMGSRLHGNDGLGVVSGESPSPLPSPVKGEGAGGSRGWVPRIEYGAGSVCTGTTVWVLCPGIHPHPCPLPSRERGPEAAGDGFPVSSTGQAPFPWERRFGWPVSPTPFSYAARGGRVSKPAPTEPWRAVWGTQRCDVCVRWMGSHPHPCPLPSRERGPEAAGDALSRLHGNDGQGRGGRRQPGMGSPYRVRGRLRLHGNDGLGGCCVRGWVTLRLHPCPLPSRERGPEAAGDGFPVSSTGQAPFVHGNDGCGRCVRGFTLTPALSRQGRGGRRQPGMGSPYRVRGRLRLHGNDGLGVVSGESPSPLPSPVEGEGAGGSRGWVPRIEYGAGSVCTGTTVWALCPGSHPSPLPSPVEGRGGRRQPGMGSPYRVRGRLRLHGNDGCGRCVRGVTLTPSLSRQGRGGWSHPHPCPLPSRERRPEAGDGFPLKAGTTMWRTGTAVGWSRLVRRPGCPGLAG